MVYLAHIQFGLTSCGETLVHNYLPCIEFFLVKSFCTMKQLSFLFVMTRVVCSIAWVK